MNSREARDETSGALPSFLGSAAATLLGVALAIIAAAALAGAFG